MNRQSSEKMSSLQPVKRFLGGALVGMLFALLYWSYSIFTHSNPSLVQGVVGLLVSAIAGGVMTLFTSVDQFMDNLPWI